MDAGNKSTESKETTFKYEVRPKSVRLHIINDFQTTSLIWAILYRTNGITYVKRAQMRWRGEATPERMELFAENLEVGTQDKIFTSAPIFSITLGELDNVPIIIIKSGLTSIIIAATEATRYSLARVVRWYAQFCRDTPQQTREPSNDRLGNYDGGEDIGGGYDSDRD